MIIRLLLQIERHFMLSLTDNNQAGVIEAFNSTSRYIDDLLNIYRRGSFFMFVESGCISTNKEFTVP